MARARAAEAWVSAGWEGMAWPVIAASRPAGATTKGADHGGWGGGEPAFPIQLRHALQQALLQVVGAAAGFGGVQAGTGLAGFLLQLQGIGAAVPVGDFLGETLLDGGAGLGDPLHAPFAHFADVLGHDVGDGFPLGGDHQLAGDPGALWAGEDVRRGRLGIAERAVVQVRRVVQVAATAGRIHRHVQHPARECAFTVPHRVLQREEGAWFHAGVAVVHQHRAALQQLSVALQREGQHGVEQRVAGADECGWRLAVRREQGLLEGDAFVAARHRVASADLPVSVAHRCRHMGHFVASRLALPGRAAKLAERFQEEGFHVVRLQAPRFGAFHVLAHAGHLGGIHRVLRQGAFLDQRLQMRMVHGCADGLGKAHLHLRLVAVADGLDQQLAQRAALELQLAEYVEHLPAEGEAGLLQLVEQGAVHVALAGFRRHQVPQVAHLALADAVDAPEALLQAVRVPRQVVVHHQMGALQVDAFAGGVRSQQHMAVTLRVLPSVC